MRRILLLKLLWNKPIQSAVLASMFAVGLTECFAEDSNTSLLDVLKRESQGLSVDRVSELKPLIENDKNQEARWHSGDVLVAGTWIPISEVAEEQLSSTLKEYLKLRGNENLSADSHRKLAKWCQNKGLSDQCAAHWYGVLQTSQDDAEARQILGFERIGSQWFSKADLKKATKVGSTRLQDFKVWMPKMQQLAIAVSNSDTRKKSKAMAEIKNIEDPSALQALYMTAVQLQGDYARPFVEAIKKQRSAEACLALVKIAIASPESIAAETAIAGMKEYRLEFYVPELLALIEDDMGFRQDMVTRPNGELVLEQAMFRERSDVKSMQIIDKIITLDSAKLPVGARLVNGNQRRVFNSGGNATTTTTLNQMYLVSAPENETAKIIATRNAQREAEKTEDLVRQENSKTKEVRERIVSVLKATTGANPGESAQEWWNWWEHECEDNRISSKPYVTGYSKNYDSLIYQRQNSTVTSSQTITEPRRRCECLVAGTSVQTLAGLRAVESIKTGDMVLSSDVDSGKIEFKPVLRTTVRPPAETMRIVTDAEPIQATLGHYWWVAGHGWLRTKEIVAGMRLHTATGTSLVESVELVPEKAVTYNLIVADNHSYFVGSQRVLSNDASELKPTLLTVPGFSVARHSVP